MNIYILAIIKKIVEILIAGNCRRNQPAEANSNWETATLTLAELDPCLAKVVRGHLQAYTVANGDANIVLTHFA